MALQLPWILAGGTPCCCPCGWEEFGTPSDPPVYYKTKTTAGTYSWANSGTNPDANCTSLLVSGSFTLVETKEVNEANECIYSITCTGSASSSYNCTSDPGCGTSASCSGSFNASCEWIQSGSSCDSFPICWGTSPYGPSAWNLISQTSTVQTYSAGPWFLPSGGGTQTITLSDPV